MCSELSQLHDTVEVRTRRDAFFQSTNNLLKTEKEEKKRKKRQVILQHAAKSVGLLSKEDELKKVNAALQHVLRRQQEQAKINQAETKEKEEARKEGN